MRPQKETHFRASNPSHYGTTTTTRHNTSNLDSPRLVNGDSRPGLPARSAKFLDLPDDIQALDDFSKHNVFPIEPAGDDLPGIRTMQMEGMYSGDEELRFVGVGTGVCHGEETGFRVLQFEVFVSEFLSIDGFSTHTALSISSTSL